METPEFVVKYFGLYGRAEPVRIALALSGAKWKDEIIKQEDFPALKKELPNGYLPVLIENGKAVKDQGKACARYIC